MKRNLGLPKNVRDNVRLQNEIKHWDQHLHSLHLAVKYKQANTEEDMELKIAQWRTYAQKAAMALLPYYQEQAKSLSPYNEYGGRSLSGSTDLNDTLSNEMENNSQEEDQSEKKADGSAALDDMVSMLNAIGINPDMLHYSTKLGEFY